MLRDDDLRASLACSLVDTVGQGPGIACEETDCGQRLGL
jgi:hypothetical protein